MSTSTSVQPLGAKTALALTYTAADATGNRLKTYDGSADYPNNGGLLLFIRNTSGVAVTASGSATGAQSLNIPAGSAMVFGPFGSLTTSPLDITWSTVAGVSIAAVDALTLGRRITLTASVTGTNTSTDVVTVAWALAIDGIVVPLPSWATFDLLWKKDGTSDPAQTTTTIAGVTSPYPHQKLGAGGHGWDLVASGTVGTLYYRLQVRDASGTIVGRSDFVAVNVSHA